MYNKKANNCPSQFKIILIPYIYHFILHSTEEVCYTVYNLYVTTCFIIILPRAPKEIQDFPLVKLYLEKR